MQPDTTNTPSANFSSTTAKPPGLFQTRVPSTVSFAVAILLFFLPFAQIKCGGMVAGEQSGFGLALGSPLKTIGNTGFFGKMEAGDQNTEKEKKQDPNLYAIVALGLGVLGLIISFGNAKGGGIGGMIAGLISAGALVGLYFDLKNSLDSKIPHGNKNVQESNIFGDIGNGVVSIEFTPWFYIAVIAFLAAAGFCFRRWQK